MSDSENLGPPVTWTIRNVPTGVRDAIVAQVGRDETVADVLTRLVLHNQGAASDVSSNVSDTALAALATATATLASADLPPALKRDAYAALRARFRAARGLPPVMAKRRQPPTAIGGPPINPEN